MYDQASSMVTIGPISPVASLTYVVVRRGFGEFRDAREYAISTATLGGTEMFTAAPAIERSLARCRLALALMTLLVVYLDPSEPLMARWVPIPSGIFTLDPYTLTILTAYLCFSVGVLALPRDLLKEHRVSSICMWCDAAFGAAVAFFTEGATSPSGTMFLFAVMEAASIDGMRRALFVTGVTVIIRSGVIVALTREVVTPGLIRPMYMALLGYVIGYLGQQRLNLENGIRELAGAMERERVARDLHDGHAQALAGIGLRVGTCRALLRSGRQPEAERDLSELEQSINQEYDALRTYTRILRGADIADARPAGIAQTHFAIRVQFEGSGTLVDGVLQILREGVWNVMRHAHAAR